MKSFTLPAALRRHTASIVARILSPRGVLVAGIVLLMFSWGLSTSLLIEARRDAYDHAVENARNLMLLIERDIARNIGSTICRCRTSSTALPILNWRPCPAPASPAAVRPRGDRRVSRVDLRDGRARQYRDRFERIARPARQFRRPRLFRRASRPARPGPLHQPAVCVPAARRRLDDRPQPPDQPTRRRVRRHRRRHAQHRLLPRAARRPAVGKHGSAAIVEDNGTLVSRLPFDPHVVGLDLHSSPLFIESQRAATAR